LKLIATLSTQGMPWGSPSPLTLSEVLAGGFLSVAFHPAREWLCASTGRGLVGVWNLDGVVGRRGGDEGQGSGAGSQGQSGLVRPFAARVITAEADAAEASNSNNDNDNSSGSLVGAGNASPTAGGTANAPSPSLFGQKAAVTAVFLASEPVVMVALSVGLGASAPGLLLANERLPSSRLVLLSLLDATLPVLYSIVAPHAIENLCVEPR
ncbi:unnamed protein product, partial [Ectocarpus fasciculatus]